jgi:ATP-dependent DNA helicase PIF1
MGKSLNAFNLEHLKVIETNDLRRTRDIADALDSPIPEDCINCKEQFNPVQKEAFNAIIEHVAHEKAGAFFIDGPGGTGKTFLYNALYAEVRLMGKIVLPTATSGIAASNLPTGRTAHSRFKIPIDINAALACDVPRQGSLAALIRECSLIIWDEASMARRENVESLDTLLRDLCNPAVPFGGKIVVFGGDFRQVLPVVPQKTQQEAVGASMVNSRIWPSLIKFRLSENMRAREDPQFAAFLLALGNGQLQTEENALIQLPMHIIQTCAVAEEPITTLGESIFPEISNQLIDPDIFTDRAILTPLNDDVDLINSILIDKFQGDAVTYKSFDSVLDDHCNLYPTEFVNKLCPGGMSPHELILKIGCPVILLRNLLPAFGLCNGTRLVCTRFFPNLIQCVITTGQHKGQVVCIPRIDLRPPASKNYPFQFHRRQFPIKLSFAMTINKSQGQTLGQVAIYLPRPCFSAGQLYVALSRARKASKVSVLATDPSEDGANGYVKNVVSYDVLRLAGII